MEKINQFEKANAVNFPKKNLKHVLLFSPLNITDKESRHRSINIS